MFTKFPIAVILVCLALAGCGTPPGTVLPSQASSGGTLEIVNLSAYNWEITCSAIMRADPEARSSREGENASSPRIVVTRIESHSTVLIELAAGDYEISQKSLGGVGVNRLDGAQRFSLSLAAGERLRWRLATLIDNADGGLAP